MEKGGRIQIVIVFTLFVVFFAYIIYNKIVRDLYHKYTIGVITSIGPVAEGVPMADYSYYVDGVLYECTNDLQYSMQSELNIHVGDTCYVLFQTNRPSNAEMLLNKKASVIQYGKLPLGGWDQIPQ